MKKIILKGGVNMPEVLTEVITFVEGRLSSATTLITGSFLLMLPVGFWVVKKGVNTVKSFIGIGARRH